MSWYVIEGPDQTGKTTLARELERRGWRYVKCTEMDQLPVLAKRMALLTNDQNVVWDRAHLSEAMHHPDRVDQQWFELVEALLHARNATCLLLLTRKNGSFENDDLTHARLVDQFIERAGWSAMEWEESVELPPAIEGWTDKVRR